MSDKLAKIEDQSINPYQPKTFDDAWRLAKITVESRLAFGVDTPAQAFMILATGNELGLSAMQSLRGIHNIKGRPCPSADTMIAVIMTSGKAEYFREVSNDGQVSTWETKRTGNQPQRYSFSMKDAQLAGLGGSNWSKYPKRMLAARAKAFLARDVYPDLVLGLYTLDEIAEDADIRAPMPVCVDASRDEPVRSDLATTMPNEPVEAEFVDEPEPERQPGTGYGHMIAMLDHCKTQDEIDAMLPRLKQARADSAPNLAEIIDAYKRATARVKGAQQ